MPACGAQMTRFRFFRRSQAGFSLVETLVAASLLATALVALAELLAIGIRTNLVARGNTMAAMLAQQKMEQLWASASLSASPAGVLWENRDGHVEYLDAAGTLLGMGPEPPEGTAYVRRWSVEPLPASPGTALALQVFVTRRIDRGGGGRGVRERQPEEARFVAVKTSP